MELLINMANVLYLLSYFVRDMLRLRLLTVVAAGCLTTYFYLQPEPLMTAVYWNVGFIGLNLFRIARDRKTASRAAAELDPPSRPHPCHPRRSARRIGSAAKCRLAEVASGVPGGSLAQPRFG